MAVMPPVEMHKPYQFLRIEGRIMMHSLDIDAWLKLRHTLLIKLHIEITAISRSINALVEMLVCILSQSKQLTYCFVQCIFQYFLQHQQDLHGNF